MDPASSSPCSICNGRHIYPPIEVAADVDYPHVAQVKVVSDAVQDIPHGALLVELTPDGRESSLDWQVNE